MAFENKYVDFGVIKVEKNRAGENTVNIYFTQQSFLTLNTSGGVPVSANWAGDQVVVHFSDGKVRKYSAQQSFQNI
jgi:hypothetical protein